jgi:hypothetical protein
VVLKAPPGAELLCRAANFKARAEGNRSRGVVSYYATRALAQAGRLDSWLQRIAALVESDLRDGQLTKLQAPTLQVLGDAGAPAPGRPGKD